MTYILYLITLFAFIVSLIAAVYYFRKYNKIRNRLPDIDGEEELMKPYNLLMQELEQKQQQLKQQSLQHHLLVKAIKLKLWKWDLKRKEIIWEGNLEKGEQGTVVVDVDEHLSHVLPEYRKRIYEAIDGLEKGCSKLIDEEFLYQNADNTLSWRNIYGIIYEYDEGGKPAILIGGTQIIDERKKLESDLRKAKDKAEESNRLKTAFLANMSHEIRTPLNAIVGFSSLLTSTESAAEKELYNSLIGHNNKLLLNLINDVIDLSKIESGYLELRPDWVNLTELLDESVAEYAHQVPSGVELLTNYPAHDSLVELDKLRIKQILSNFLSNALKNTTTGHVEIFYEVDHQSVRIGVKDTGRGIPQNMLEKIFERFEKLDSFAQGAGLGLPICKLIVEKMNGRILVDSQLGIGTTFIIELPCRSMLVE